MIRIFISYSRSDSDIAHRLKKSLERRGCEVWIDRTEIAAGRIGLGSPRNSPLQEVLPRAMLRRQREWLREQRVVRRPQVRSTSI
jgi:hypothetical protein